jgi:DNA-binding transcriptional LysR family regulator
LKTTLHSAPCRQSPSTHYELTDLRVFLAIADEKNVSRGAQRCHLVPSSASLRLKGLEEAVGTPLFTRHARGVELTRAGIVMAQHARRCMSQLDQMHVELMPFVQGLAGHITCFANNNALCSHLPEDLARFFERYPSVRMTLQEHLSSDIVTAVAAGRADIGIVALEKQHPDLTYIPYRVDQLVLLAPQDSAIAQVASIRFADCLSQPFISLSPGAALHTYLTNQANALGAHLDVRVQVSSYSSIARLVASGAGLGIVPRSALTLSDYERVACLDLAETWARRELHVCIRTREDGESPFVKRLVGILCPNSLNNDLSKSRPRGS